MNSYTKAALNQGYVGPLLQKIVVMDRQECVFVDLHNILYIEGKGSYALVCLRTGDRMMVSKPIKAFCDRLPATSFYRIHKSYLVNILCIHKYVKTEQAHVVMENGDMLPVATRKKDLMSQLVEVCSL